MAFIDLHYMNQVLSHVVNNYGAKMTEKQVEDVASVRVLLCASGGHAPEHRHEVPLNNANSILQSLISELRRVYDLETSDGQSNRE